MIDDLARRRFLSAAPAFTLVEAVVSVAIVGVLLVAALNTLAAARRSELSVSERARALALGQDLLAEILRQPYADPVEGSGSFGLEAGESTPGNRSLYDDVDDYNGWSAKPPQYPDGTVVPEATDYARSVSVAWVKPDNLDVASAGNTGVKRITVVVSRQDRELITLVGYRTECWVDPAEWQGSTP